MSQLLEILGRAITVDTAELIWHWLNAVTPPTDDSNDGQYFQLNKAIELITNKKTDAAAERLRMYLFENPSCIYGRMTAAAICLYNNQLQEAINDTLCSGMLL
jgi:predicted Zn-dependent protease